MGIVTRIESGAEIAEAIPFLGINGQEVSFDDLSADFPELVFDLDEELAGDMAEFQGFGS
jgi:hypothetical protein